MGRLGHAGRTCQYEDNLIFTLWDTFPHEFGHQKGPIISYIFYAIHELIQETNTYLFVSKINDASEEK